MRTEASGAGDAHEVRDLGVLVLEIVRAGDGSPLPGVGVVLEPFDGKPGHNDRCFGVSDARGRCSFDHLDAGFVEVRLDRGPVESVEVQAGSLIEHRIVVPSGADVAGRVVDPDGKPVAGAEVWVYPSSQHLDHERGQAVTRTASDGTFLLQDVARSDAYEANWLGARAPGFGPSSLLWLWRRDSSPHRIEVTLTLTPAAAGIDGLVLDPDGQAYEGAVVVLQPQDEERTTDDGWLRDPRVLRVVRSDRLGWFTINDLEAGYSFLKVETSEHAPLQQRVEVPETGRVSVTLRLEAGASVRVRVVEATGGSPLKAAWVGVRGSTTARRSDRARTDVTGHVRFDGLAPGHARLWAHAENHEDAELDLELRAGEQASARFELQALDVLRGLVVDERGGPLAGWRVFLHGPDGRNPYSLHAITDEGGRFVRQVRPGRLWLVRVQDPKSPFTMTFPDLGPFSSWREGTVEEHEEILIRVPDARRPTSWLEGTLLDSDGTPPAEPRLELTDGELGAGLGRGLEEATYEPDSGHFRLGPIPPRDYSLVIAAGGTAEFGFVVGPFSVSPGATTDLGTITVSTTGRLVYSFEPEPGCTPREVRIEYRAEPRDSRAWHVVRAGEGLRGTLELAPGDYRMTVWGEGFRSQVQAFTIRPGEDTAWHTTLVAAVRRPIRLALPPGEERATFVVRDARGQVVYDDEFGRDENTVVNRWPNLSLGWHEVEVTGQSGRRWRGRFEVPDLLPTREPLRFVLEPVRR